MAVPTTSKTIRPINPSLMVVPAADTTGMPANRLWYETAGPPLQQAFFKLEAKLRNAGDGSFDQWLSAHGLSGTAVALFQQDRNGDHVPNGLEYVFGANLPTDGPLLKIRSVNGRTVLEAPEQDAATMDDGNRQAGSGQAISRLRQKQREPGLAPHAAR